MEYGLISNINQYADNQEILIQQIKPSTEIAKLSDGEEAKKLAKDSFFKNVEESNSTQEVTNETAKSPKAQEVTAQEIAQFQEVVLTNLNFGYNEASKDFFVKSVRGDSESQFPTDEMMKLKAYFIAQSKAEQAAELNS